MASNSGLASLRILTYGYEDALAWRWLRFCRKIMLTIPNFAN